MAETILNNIIKSVQCDKKITPFTKLLYFKKKKKSNQTLLSEHPHVINYYVYGQRCYNSSLYYRPNKHNLRDIIHCCKGTIHQH